MYDSPDDGHGGPSTPGSVPSPSAESGASGSQSLVDLVGTRESSPPPVHPLHLFGTLEIRSDDLQDMWVPQGDALRAWHESRTATDVLFKLNTGAGKTLIGLLAAQSLVNETRGKVLYVCATNQLLEQTAQKAAEYGIEVASYYEGVWHGDAYDRGQGPLLTNYHAVFNGKSVLEREDVAAVVFDDAHTASSIIRDQFTLSVLGDRYPAAYGQLTDLVGTYFVETRRARGFAEVVQGEDPYSVFFVPLFISAPLGREIEEILVREGVVGEAPATFPWGHLRGRLADCGMLVRTGRIEFSPLVPPVHDLRPFREGVRRLYLSATLETGPEFCRTFGRAPDLVIAPGGRAGETERMILPAPREIPENEAIEWARELIAPHKALIMVPSYWAADAWSGVAEVFTGGGDARIREFASSDNADKLVLVGRYDGIDLPGDACRFLVLDGLPIGRSLLETFFTDQLELEGLSQGIIASRIVQLLGRISRGMSDHGVFLLVGRRLRRWLDDPRNRSLLPEHIQGQLALGDRLAEHYADRPPAELIRMCLGRDPGWLEAHREFTRKDREENGTTLGGTAVDLALAEVDYVVRLWREGFEEAAQALARVEEDAFSESKRLGAWHLHWIAHALKLAGREADALERFQRAAKACPELGRPQTPDEIRLREGDPKSRQAQLMADLILKQRGKLVGTLEEAEELLASGTGSANQDEEAVRQIGAALGLEASRPDDELEAGPDVLWLTPSHDLALFFELKTKKDATDYRKEEVGQLHNHIRWVRDEYPEARQTPFVVGPRRGCTPNASPPPEVRVVSADELARLCGDVRRLYGRVVAETGDLLTPATIHSGMTDLQLGWDVLAERLESVELTALSIR